MEWIFNIGSNDSGYIFKKNNPVFFGDASMTDHPTEKVFLKVGFRWLILEEYSNKWNARMLETEIQLFIGVFSQIGFPNLFKERGRR